MMTRSSTISEQLATLAAELLADAKAHGLTVTTLADGSMVTTGTGEVLRQARVANIVALAAELMKEVGR